MLHAIYQGAGTAGAASLSWLGGLKAIDRLAKTERQGASSHSLRSGEKISVAQVMTGYVFAQQSNRPLMTEHIPTHGMIVAERADNFNGWRFSFDTILRNHYNLGVWISLQVSTHSNSRR
jgi:hypothetical protein